MVNRSPRGPFFASSLTLNGIVIASKIFASRPWINCLSRYFSRPRSVSWICTRLPSARNSSAFFALRTRSCDPVPSRTRIPLISTSFAFFLDFRASLSSWYWYLPRSIMRATGGFAVGEISMRSSPSCRAISSASPVGLMPKFSPDELMTRTSGARIALLMRGFGTNVFLVYPYMPI